MGAESERIHGSRLLLGLAAAANWSADVQARAPDQLEDSPFGGTLSKQIK